MKAAGHCEDILRNKVNQKHLILDLMTKDSQL